MSLKIQPELRAVAEIQTQAQRSISSDPATVAYDLGDPIRGDVDCLSELVLGKAVLGEKLFLSISPGVTRANSCFTEPLLMVVKDTNLLSCIRSIPSSAN